MAISEELKDAARASAVLRDATPYIQKRYGKDIHGDVMINEINFLYYLTPGDIDNALDQAQWSDNLITQEFKVVFDIKIEVISQYLSDYLSCTQCEYSDDDHQEYHQQAEM